MTHSQTIPISKIEGRIKDREECMHKFNLKYRKALEADEIPYMIKEHISDLIGIRVVCLYEDDIDVIRTVLEQHFDTIEVTNKSAQMESTEGSFGYKGLHLDLRLGSARQEMPEYKSFVDFNFELQIRTIIQDSWSVLDHKIKYKKSIPTPLKRRINTLAALFELADREFREIRSATEDEIKKAEAMEDDAQLLQTNMHPHKVYGAGGELTAFGFLKIAKHFFSNDDFEPHKVDGFTQEIVSLAPNMTRMQFNEAMKNHIAKVKVYKAHYEKENGGIKSMNPYTLIRHCLYLTDASLYASLLTRSTKENFDQWLKQGM
nr:(p)ppGpp synthetase [Wohlfahrtiimonas chitiniclastica]